MRRVLRPQAPERPPRGRSGGGIKGRGGRGLPKPPQGHGGFKRRIERKPPRRQGTAPLYTNKSAKEQMLAVAREAAEQRGYEAMRVAEITDAAGVTRQAFYAHFRDKRHCLCEAIDPKLGAIERMAASLSESDPDSAAKIAHAIDDLIAERYGSEEGTRGRIITATGELLLEGRTLHEVTIGQIVKAAHIPQGDFYKQFSTKRECFAVLYERLLGELVDEVGEGSPAEPSAECPAEHTGHELPALLGSLGEILASDSERLRLLLVESAHLPEAPDPGRPGAWRGSLVASVTELIAASQKLDAADPTARFLAASVVEVVRSAAVGPRAEDLPNRLRELAAGCAPGLLGAEAPLAA